MPRTVDFAAIPSGVILTDDRVRYLAERSAETMAAFLRLIDKLQATFAEARDNYSREADQFVRDNFGTGAGTTRDEREALAQERSAAERVAKVQAANRVSAVKKNLLANSEGNRREMLDQLARFAAEAEQIASVTATPVMLLGRTGLADPRRVAIQSTLEGAGPLELETAARTAILLGDVVMAAAVATVVDRRPRDRRPFMVQPFAERIVGAVWAELDAKLKAVALALRRAQAAEREFIRGKADPLTSVSLALAQREVNAAMPATDDDEGEA